MAWRCCLIRSQQYIFSVLAGEAGLDIFNRSLCLLGRRHCHIVAYMLYIISAGKILPTITGVLETVEPLTAILLSWLLFSQKMNTPMLIGASMILAAVVFLGFVGSKRNFQ